MCLTVHYRSRCCGHHWLQIWAPCGPGRGFYTCGDFADGCAREAAPECAVASLCPACALSSRPCPCNGNGNGAFGPNPTPNPNPNNSNSLVSLPSTAASGYGYVCNACGGFSYGYDYDRQYVRMVTDIRERVRWGEGPCRRDPGIDCVVM